MANAVSFVRRVRDPDAGTNNVETFSPVLCRRNKMGLWSTLGTVAGKHRGPIPKSSYMWLSGCNFRLLSYGSLAQSSRAKE